MIYVPAENRYDRMVYRHCGAFGLKLPVVSLGLWAAPKRRSAKS